MTLDHYKSVIDNKLYFIITRQSLGNDLSDDLFEGMMKLETGKRPTAHIIKNSVKSNSYCGYISDDPNEESCSD